MIDLTKIDKKNLETVIVIDLTTDNSDCELDSIDLTTGNSDRKSDSIHSTQSSGVESDNDPCQWHHHRQTQQIPLSFFQQVWNWIQQKIIFSQQMF